MTISIFRALLLAARSSRFQPRAGAKLDGGGVGFRVLEFKGLRFKGLGFKGLGSRVWGVKFRDP